MIAWLVLLIEQRICGHDRIATQFSAVGVTGQHGVDCLGKVGPGCLALAEKLRNGSNAVAGGGNRHNAWCAGPRGDANQVSMLSAHAKPDGWGGDC